jgi:hypothetical protein
MGGLFWDKGRREVLAMRAFATIEDMANLWRALTETELARAPHLLEVASDTLRQIAQNRGLNLDSMIYNGEIYESVLKDVVVAAVGRALRASTTGEPVSQVTQSALGYSVSGTFLNPQGGMFFYDNELARLGLGKRQKLGRIEMYGTDDES